MVYFANNVQLPFDPSGRSSPDKAPWVLVGGSYSGALAAWTEITAPGTFWAYHASSASIQAIEDFICFVLLKAWSISDRYSGNTSNQFNKACRRTAARTS